MVPPEGQVDQSQTARTGVIGLDDILAGGLTRSRLFLIEGVPGSGKTTLALQFLMAGASAGEGVLYVTLSETADELRAVAASHGWSLEGVTILELMPSEAELEPEHQNTIFHPAEVELAATTKRVLEDVDRLKPSRVVFDSLSELRLLAGAPLRYRRQILALKQSFATRRCTVVLLDDMTAADHDLQMQSIVHGVIRLEQLAPEYGGERRRLRVTKYRGVAYPRRLARLRGSPGRPRGLSRGSSRRNIANPPNARCSRVASHSSIVCSAAAWRPARAH